MYLRALEFFISLKRAASPKFGKTAQGILSVKEYSKAKLCGKERILLAKMVPKYINRNSILLVYVQINPCQALYI